MKRVRKPNRISQKAQRCQNEPGFNTGEQISIMGRLTQGAAAWLMGITPRAIRDMAVPRNADGTYSGREAHAWDIERRKRENEIDPLMSGGTNSQALEEYRREKVREVKRKNDIEEGKLIPVADVAQLWAEVGEELRQEFETVARTIPPEAGAALTAAIDRISKNLTERYITPRVKDKA